jgi:hypothetical protein
MDALQERSRQIRSHRKALDEAIRAEEISVAEVLTDEIPDWLERVPLIHLLSQPYRIPTKLVHQFLADCPVQSELQKVGRTTTRQREWLAGAILSWEARRDEGRFKEGRKARVAT